MTDDELRDVIEDMRDDAYRAHTRGDFETHEALRRYAHRIEAAMGRTKEG